MIGWIALGVALVVVLGVLGFCAYELRWRSARLQKDLAGLQQVIGGLTQVGADLTIAQQRAVRLQGGLRQPLRR